MRCSWLFVALCLVGGCARQDTRAFRRIAILPVENLDADPAGGLNAEALRIGIWDSFQGQPALHAVLANHRRELPGLQAAYVVEGYAASGRYRLRLNDQLIECSGTLADCAERITGQIAVRVGVTPRPAPKAETLLQLARARAGEESPSAMEKAASADPSFATVWIGWSGLVQRQSGPQAALAVLERAPLTSMPAYDAARLRVRVAELRQDRKAFGKALMELARLSPADVDVQERAAREAAAARNFGTALEIYERLLAVVPSPPLNNQAAYLAAFAGDRAKAERYATAAHNGAPMDPQFLDTRGEIAYFFADFKLAAQYFEQAAGLNITFQGGIDLWKAAESARLAGETARGEALLQRYLEFRMKAGQRNTLIAQAVWDWRGDDPSSANEKLRTAANSLDKGKALFLLALMAVNRQDRAGAERTRLEMDPQSIEFAFLRCLLTDAPLPPGFPAPPEAISALRLYLRGEKEAAKQAFGRAQVSIDPLTEGQWRKFDAILHGRKPDGLLPATPDDWLAVLLR